MFPNITCSICTLQLQFKTSAGIIYQCADMSLVAGENLSCAGKCVNGGSCYNGKCHCPSGYGGEFCDGKGAFENNNPSLWLILLIILLIVAFMVIFGLCVIKFINKKEKRYQTTDLDHSVEPDVYDNHIENATTINEDGPNVRNAYKHHKFEDEE